MKLWEVLKALEENPEKVFECDTGSRIKFFDNRLHWYDKHGNPKEAFEIRDKRSGTGACHNTGDFWHEVKQPVTWQEAIEAWTNGKTIRCEDGGYDYLFSGGKNTLTDSVGPIDKYQITKGTWYIED